jgi:hypothetical protein
MQEGAPALGEVEVEGAEQRGEKDAAEGGLGRRQAALRRGPAGLAKGPEC